MHSMIRTNLKLIFLCTGILIAAIIIDRAYHEYYATKLAEVVVLDVGQGSSAYIADPGGYELVIDTGPTMEGIRGIWRYRPFWDRTIDEVLISHGDRDHMAMLPYLIRHFDISHISWAVREYDNALLQTTQELIDLHNQGTQAVSFGDSYSPSEYLEIDILWPRERYESSNRNNRSVVAQLSYGEMDILFPGDIEASVERELVDEYGSNLQSEVLILSHHGSRTSSAQEFLQAVDPELVIVSAGADNPYGHPHAEVTQRVRKLGIPLLSTAEAGDIRMVSSTSSIVVHSH
jgi:competence protein ComEC